MTTEQIKQLHTFAQTLPDDYEKVVILVLLGNLYAGVSNEPLAILARNIAKQIRKDLI